MQYAHQCLTWIKEAANTVALGDLATGTNTKRSIQTVTKVFEKEILVESCFALMKPLCYAVTEENQLALPLITSIYMLL